MLPGEADAAVHLDAVLGASLGGGRCEGGGHRRGELVTGFFVVPVLLGRLVQSAGRIPHCGGCPHGGGEHLGAAVLDGLELADRPAELLADLRVLRGGVGGPAREADRLCGSSVVAMARPAACETFDSRVWVPASTELARTCATGRNGSTDLSGSISRRAVSNIAHSMPLSIATGATRTDAWAAEGTERASPGSPGSPRGGWPSARTRSRRRRSNPLEASSESNLASGSCAEIRALAIAEGMNGPGAAA